MNPSRIRSNHAFTLVEILVVILILGLISAVVIPQIGSRDDVRVAAAARIVMSDLVYVQNRAITTQQSYYVRFTSSGYGVYTTATGGSPITHPVTKRPYTVAFGSGGTTGLVTSSIGTANFDNQRTLMFDELGAPSAYNALTATTAALANAGTIPITSGSQTLTIQIEPFTGDITISSD